jgi:Glycosyl hydrolase catalytic core
MSGVSRLACILSSILVFTTACHINNFSIVPPPPTPSVLNLTVSSTTAVALQDGTPASVTVTVQRPAGTSRSVTLSVLSAPAGVAVQIDSPGSGDAGSVTFTSSSAAAGTYTLAIQASDGQATGIANVSLTVAVVATIGTTTNPLVGRGGKLDDFMTTSFQPASWTDNFFTSHPDATVALNALAAEHIRIQELERDIPMTSATTWDFSYLDAMVNPILSVTDHSPEFQIAAAPAWMNDANGNLDMANHLQDFVDYCANMVRYYNTGGFDANGTHYQSPSLYPITWWGIFNEPNIHGLTPAQYVQLYNAVVPAMQAVDPTLKFSAVELADFGTEPEKYMPTFVSSVTAQVDVVSTHFYSTCNQKDSDQQLFNTIPGFVSDVKYIYSQLATNPALANVPIWVTENNVNADYNSGNGMSACNPGTPFVTDLRGTSGYFAAWRPFVYSQLSQAGVEGLYHWDYNADAQYGEVDGGTGQIYRSYWVDYWLGRYFAPATSPNILGLNVTEASTIETLAVQSADGSVVVMIANRAVRATGDNNGPGAPRTVVVDLSAWPAFSTASLLTIDASTDPAAGPVAVPITPAARLTINFSNYGVAFLRLTP